MPIWTSNYKTVPQSFKNPGQGAFHFRDFKEAVEERGAIEHIWGQPETDLSLAGGLHREGSARVMVQDEGTALRGTDERITADTQRIGRTEIDLELLTVRRQQDGENISITNAGDYTSQLRKTITVYGAEIDANGTPVAGTDPDQTLPFVVFDYDKFVDIYQDQGSINGVKRFILSPQVPNFAEAGDASVREGWENYLDTATAFEKQGAVNIDEVSEIATEARDWNIFDSTNDDNPTIVDLDSPTGDVTLHNIEAQEIYGTIVRGAVWA